MSPATAGGAAPRCLRQEHCYLNIEHSVGVGEKRLAAAALYYLCDVTLRAERGQLCYPRQPSSSLLAGSHVGGTVIRHFGVGCLVARSRSSSALGWYADLKRSHSLGRLSESAARRV